MELSSLLNLPLGKHPGSYLNDALKVDLLEGQTLRRCLSWGHIR